MEAPQNPVGAFVPLEEYSRVTREEFIKVIETVPTALGDAVTGLSENQLDTRYRNWTVRQIVHHLADSHLNCFVRFKLALTEETPTIKPYDESRWAELEDAKVGDIRPSLALLQGLHSRWTRLLRSMTDGHFARSFFHPEKGQNVSLSSALCYYAWHSRHHTGQILWLRQERGW